MCYVIYKSYQIVGKMSFPSIKWREVADKQKKNESEGDSNMTVELFLKVIQICTPTTSLIQHELQIGTFQHLQIFSHMNTLQKMLITSCLPVSVC